MILIGIVTSSSKKSQEVQLIKQAPIRSHAQSDAMKGFLYQAYGKEPDSLSKEELATMTYLNIDTVETDSLIDDYWTFT